MDPLSDGVTLAHGIGGAQDLPIPPLLAIAGAVGALTVSFTVLAIAWRTPRYDAATDGRPAPGWLASLVDSRAYRWGYAPWDWLCWRTRCGSRCWARTC